MSDDDNFWNKLDEIHAEWQCHNFTDAEAIGRVAKISRGTEHVRLSTATSIVADWER